MLSTKKKQNQCDIMKDALLWLIIPIILTVCTTIVIFNKTNNSVDEVFTGLCIVANIFLLWFTWNVVLKFRNIVALLFSLVLCIPLIVIGQRIYYPAMYFVTTTLLYIVVFLGYKIATYIRDRCDSELFVHYDSCVV